MNSGENLRRAASTAVRSTFWSSPASGISMGCTKPIPPCISSVISPPPRLEVRKITVCDRSTRRLSPSVNVALSKIPSSSCHSASEAFSISSNSKNDSFSFSVWLLASSSCVISGCVSRCPRYPGGEPISFAISWECWNSAQSTLIMARGVPNRTSAAASTTRVFRAPVGPKNKQISHRSSWSAQSSAKHLIQLRDCLHSFVLSDDLSPQCPLKLSQFTAAKGRIQSRYWRSHLPYPLNATAYRLG